MLTNEDKTLKRRFTDTEVGRLRNSLILLCEWLRSEMKHHVNPPDSGTYLLKSEHDVNNMIAAYLAKLFHYIFQLSGDSMVPHNTSILNRFQSIDDMSKLSDFFAIEEKFQNSPVKSQLDFLKNQVSSWLKSDAAIDNKIWAGCHLWLEQKLVTGNRLLFLEGEQWGVKNAPWTMLRIPQDWPNTFAKSIMQGFRRQSEMHFVDRYRPSSSLCTSICAFRDHAEKEDFETISGFKEGEYVYLWCGETDNELSDFREDHLVWFKDVGVFEDQKFSNDKPAYALGSEEAIKSRWSLLKELAATENSQEGGNPYLRGRYLYKLALDKSLDDLKQRKSSLPPDHWFIRCKKDFENILGDNSYDHCFWNMQSVMFYDWNYWYIFPTNSEHNPNGGLAVSSAAPLTASQIQQLSLITNTILGMFSEIEEWSRAQLRQRREQNLHLAASRVHNQWVVRTKDKKGLKIKNHKEFFKNLLNKLFEDMGETSPENDYDEITARKSFLKSTWNEHQKTNITYAVINYWNELSQIDDDRIFAEWLPSSESDDQKDWNERWNSYSAITSDARRYKKPHYTLNDFLFDKAGRKAIIEWRGHDHQIVPRGQESPIRWAITPPSITPDVASILFVGDWKTDYHSVEGEARTQKVHAQIEALSKSIVSLAPYIKKYLETCNEIFAEFKDAERRYRLTEYEKDLDSIQNSLNELNAEVNSINFPDSDEHNEKLALAAEYIVRLSIYLNCKMRPEREDFLGLSRCAFLTWALYSHFGPEAMKLKSDSLNDDKSEWNFYSIPVHVPLPNKEIQRTSILSLGTAGPLTQEELLLWRENGKEIVFPAMMIDQQKEISNHYYQKLRAGMAVGLYHQLGQVLASATARVGIIVDEGGRMREMAQKLESPDKVGKRAIDMWEDQTSIAQKRLDRAQMFRNFAYGQLIGTIVGEKENAPAKLVAEEALDVAREYLFGGNQSENITIDYDVSLDSININRDAYGFILQEILANAYAYLSGDPSLSAEAKRIQVIYRKDVSRLEVRNIISRDTYLELKQNPLNVREEPGPETQTGRGLYGVSCLFRARKIEDAPEVAYEEDKQRNCYWLVLSVPIIDFHS